MGKSDLHTFHIPVLGLGYSVDTPLKVARFGIDSVMSVIQDDLVEKMREFHSLQNGISYEAITKSVHDFRAKRVTAYLNLVQDLVDRQMEKMRTLSFAAGSEIVKYFELLPEDSALKKLYLKMKSLPTDSIEKGKMETELREAIRPGSLDINIMSKLDNLQYDKDGLAMAPEFSDAQSVLRGFALSKVSSSVVFSAGYNPRLYSYAESFDDFFPDEKDCLRKKIILKVSDYRSALIQGKIFAKKGLWVSEFRIESGLNCGGHAFATDGLLLGPILDEFQKKKGELSDELYKLCNDALAAKQRNLFRAKPYLKISAQGGIGTSAEHDYLYTKYCIDGAGWGSPFLLVPEATNVDAATLELLNSAKKSDYYLSDASPIGIPLNNIRNSTSELQIKSRIESHRPGSPCYQHFLSTDTEFSERPICTASREYQKQKIEQLDSLQLSKEEYQQRFGEITAKDCLCEGLAASAYIKNGLALSHKLESVSICPGPNLAYFTGTFTLQEMTDHIYGRSNLLNSVPRPNLFVNELIIYVDYFRNKVLPAVKTDDVRSFRNAESFRENLIIGINYYRNLNGLPEPDAVKQAEFLHILDRIETELRAMDIRPQPEKVVS